MEARTVAGTADDTEDSDASLLVVNDDDDETLAGASDNDEDLIVSDDVLPDSYGSNLVVTESSCLVTETTCSPPSPANLSADVTGNATQDAVVVTENDDNCPRQRRRYRRHHRSGSGSRRRHRLCRFKRKESNYLSATCHVIVIVLVCIALTESQWFYIRGGRCSDIQHNTINYLGIKTFFYQGTYTSFVNQNAYYYGNSLHDVLLDCVTPSAVFVMRVIIALCFIVIGLSLAGCLMDMFGPTHVVCRAIRYTASLSILSACICVVITGLCYLISEQLANYYTETPLHNTSKVLVEFNVGFYIITSAGAMSIIGVACTLMRRIHVSGSSRRRHWSSSDRRRQVNSDVERLAEIASAVCPPAGRTPPPYRR